MNLCRQPRDRHEKGSGMLEFTLMAVVLVMVIFGIFEFGRMVLVYNSIANAARAGARYAIVHGGLRTGSGVNGPSGPGANPAEVVTVVKNFAATAPINKNLLVSGTTVTVNYPNGTNQPGDPVVVTVIYQYDSFIRYFNFSGVRLGSTSRGIIVF